MPNDFHMPHAAGVGFTAGEAAVAAALDRAEPALRPADDAQLARLAKNDLGNARRLIARHGSGLAWCEELGWVAWDGARWRTDDGAALALIRAHETAEAMLAEREAIEAAGQLAQESVEEYEARLAKAGQWSVASGNRGRAEGMLISAAPYLRAKLETFDADPWALNVANGILRLNEPREPGVDTTARLYPHERSARMTRQAPTAYDPTAECPRWLAFVDQVFEGRPEVARYVQKTLGYCLTGDTSQQQMWMFEGKGANGKSTLLEAVARVIGDNAATTPIETFLHREHKSGSGPSPDIARLPGVRLLRGSEPEPGARLSESTIKQVTGGEPMAARHLNKGFFEFRPQAKLLLSVNIRPVLVGKDHGIRSRIVVVPFVKQFARGGGDARRGRTLIDELMTEAPGILNWLLEGLAGWWAEGLVPPAEVAAATKAYFDEMDPIGGFIAECCDRPPVVPADASEMATDLFRAYEAWCRASNETPREQTAFGRRLSDMGHTTKRIHGLVHRIGLQLKPEARPTSAGGRDD